MPLLKETHPQPGQPYTGTTMETYLRACDDGSSVVDWVPDWTTYLTNWDDGSSVDGDQVCRLLKVAFQRKLLFTIRDSGRKRGYKVVACWDVSHDTEKYVLMIDRLIKHFKVRDNVDFMQ